MAAFLLQRFLDDPSELAFPRVPLGHRRPIPLGRLARAIGPAASVDQHPGLNAHGFKLGKLCPFVGDAGRAVAEGDQVESGPAPARTNEGCSLQRTLQPVSAHLIGFDAGERGDRVQAGARQHLAQKQPAANKGGEDDALADQFFELQFTMRR